MISLVALRWTLSIKSIKNCWCGNLRPGRQIQRVVWLNECKVWAVHGVGYKYHKFSWSNIDFISGVCFGHDMVMPQHSYVFFFWWQWDTLGNSEAVRGFQSLFLLFVMQRCLHFLVLNFIPQVSLHRYKVDTSCCSMPRSNWPRIINSAAFCVICIKGS